ncbi:MAG: thioesterase domain protein [Chthoniobacteraceae bacterium]|nr:thioesterase domain protein [Chthoniobacteraceae bacterium]
MSDEQHLLQEIEGYFHEKIPITRAMGIRVVLYDKRQLILQAPLALNHNHLGTAFGGSLSAVATLAGYGMIWLALGDRNCHVVIRDSALSFRRPVRGDIRAVCRLPEEKRMEVFKLDFARKGKARIALKVTVEEEGEVAVDFSGTFVAIK